MVERIGLQPRPDCSEGDVLLGLASAGPHAHGYSHIRRILTSEGISYRDPAPFAPKLTIGQVLMQPTRSYTSVVGPVLRQTPAVKAIASVTNGGLMAGLMAMLPAQMAARVDLASWRLPPVFQWLRRTGNLSDADMLGVFNCGLGMVLVVDKLRTVSALKVLRDMGERPLAIGTLVNRSGGDAVRFSGMFGG
jgi:phosphoribosylaminoimidazole (AIR) synthetase